ncbi:F-box domain-containing protein [Mycena chlorophos]|uniref:F-box domain-containing protein n=1 Tax=Mycena chlorophos TaxID=658473 RepID=A0A8H6STC1_MYCCL|nr:F-box domain-containing protein [Mycena chlorophos]
MLTNSRKTVGLLNAFLPYRARWEYLSLDVNAASCALFDGPMPMLKGVELVGWDHDEATLYPSLPSFSEAPLLRSMSLWDIDLGTMTSPTWNQLTAVHLTETNAQCIPFLQQTPNLHYLCLSFDSRAMISTTDQTQAVHLPYLETLVLKNATRSRRMDDDDWTLEIFVVPNLRRLQIDARFLRTMDAVPQIGSFCEHSRCRIAEMRVMNFERRFGFDATGEWQVMQDVVERCEIFKDDEDNDEWEAEAIPFGTRMY